MDVKHKKIQRALLYGGASFTFCTGIGLAQTSASLSGGVQMIVTAEASHGHEIPNITQNDVTVRSGKEPLQVLNFVPAVGPNGAAQVLLLMDDSSNTSIGTQFESLKSFIRNLPPGVEIAIGYMRNGTVLYTQEFTGDHATAATKIRLPLGQPGADSSPYFSLDDLFKKWQPTVPRREILLISDGVDRYGAGSGAENPYVDEAIERAQRAGIIVSSLYWRGAGHYGHSFYRINWGQNYLAQLADATGGESYWQGFGDPVSFTPYLNDFIDHLNHQYLLTIRPRPLNKAGFEQVKVRTEIPGAELVGPTQVFVPAQ